MADEPHMDEPSEIRFWADAHNVRVLDGYCAGAKTDRTKAMNAILHEWAENKFREATMVLRVAGSKPTPARDDGTGGGR